MGQTHSIVSINAAIDSFKCGELRLSGFVGTGFRSLRHGSDGIYQIAVTILSVAVGSAGIAVFGRDL
jgi:hypothetical protein